MPLVVCQRKLCSSHFYAGKGPFSPPRPFFSVPIGRRSCSSGTSECLFPLVVCQRKLRSSHFYAAKGPFISRKTLLLRVAICSVARIFMLAKGPLVPPDLFFLNSEYLLTAAHVPAEAPQLAHLCWQRRVWRELKGYLSS